MRIKRLSTIRFSTCLTLVFMMLTLNLSNLAAAAEGSTEKGPLKAFPQHTAYAEGSIKPNHVPQEQLDNTVKKLYDEWKVKYLKENPYTKGQYYVWYADGDWFVGNEITVSEAHGYGMLITALMAGHDPNAKKYFDGMYRYFRAHPSEINPDLMAWQQGDTGKAIVDINGIDSATDGDLDIAYALLLAGEQWGNDGEINYLAQARKVIDAIMQSEVNQEDWILRLADWATTDKWASATRSSDFMLQHLKDFRNVSDDPRWDKVIDKTYGIIRNLYKNSSPNAGLLPDFVVKKGNSFIPAPPEFLESIYDGDYSYNSSRIPWRLGTDYLITGDNRAKDQLSTLNAWIRKTTKNDPSHIMAGYKLDGSKAIADYEDISFAAPLMVSAMVDSSNQEWLNKLWDYNAAVKTEEDLYFGNNLRLLSMIVVSGNWWSPTIVDMKASSDPGNFKDIAGHWAESNIRKAAVAGIVKGYADANFNPNRSVTRAEFAAMMMQIIKPQSNGAELTFSDTSAISEWAVKAVSQAVELGIVSGYEDGSFQPNAPISRAEMAVMIANGMNIEADATAIPGFADDNEIPGWAKKAVESAKKNGIVQGRSGNLFVPNAIASRAEAVTMLLSMQAIVEKE
ncbi:glycosyl hydrolase family 8 [Bacillus sp. FJAT-28004]|uniref:glycosyl hydrolase family 8 n=1 Tax=Bacillus sp. FJAT-28004 TaxID=1679165 RepID=UPI0007C68691|nr:glycosyl hydrolase family 8 [Bacillus sp. FJAT-28004]